jgi:hypothetical protein
MPYGHPFFLSRTEFLQEQYSVESLSWLLLDIGVRPQEYRDEGLFVLRSTVMNPFYYSAARDTQVEHDYLREFVRGLHFATRDVLESQA